MSNTRFQFGTQQWLEMVGQEMQRGLERTPQAPGYAISFVERYHGAPMLDEHTMLGFRVEIRGGAMTFQAGVTASEAADLVIDADVEVIEQLTVLKTDDPEFQALAARSMDEGLMKVTGDREIGSWSDGVHDAICDRTVPDGL